MGCTQIPYQLGGVDLSTFSFSPKAPFGLSGMYDLPSRIEKTKQDWLDDNYTEPFIRPDEFFLGGRDLVLRGYIQGDLGVLSSNYYALNQHIDSLIGDVTTLECAFGEFEVYVVDFKIVRLCPSDYSEISITFREPNPSLWGSMPVSESGGSGINSFSWDDFGMYLKDVQAWDRGSYKVINARAYGREKIRSIARGSSQFKLELGGIAESIEEIRINTGKIANLLGTSGKKTLYLSDGLYREFFLESGFKTNVLHKIGDKIYYRILMSLTEIRTTDNRTILGDADNILGNSYGEPLAFSII